MVKEFMVQAGSALFAWAFLAVASYVCAVWCFSYHVVWHQTVRWVSALIGGFALSVGLLYLINANVAQAITTIIVPAFVCVIALHTLLISLRRYLMERAPSQLHTVRFYTTLALLYVFFIGGSWLLIIVESPFLTNCAELSLNYFMYAAVIGTFILSCLISQSLPK